MASRTPAALPAAFAHVLDPRRRQGARSPLPAIVAVTVAALLATLRDTAVSLLRRAGIRAIAARLRHHRRHPADVLPPLGVAPPQNA